MVHLYVLRPLRKLRFVYSLFFKGSNSILEKPDSLLSDWQRNSSTIHPFKVALNQDTKSTGAKFVHDSDFFKMDSHGGFCTFQVEDTLFKASILLFFFDDFRQLAYSPLPLSPLLRKVHRVILCREPSAFKDMFAFPKQRNAAGADPNDLPIRLSDGAQQFRDFMWALYATPKDLYIDFQSLDRLINIAELANKYCFSSFETWAVNQIHVITRNPKGPLRSASPSTCSRLLNISALSHHDTLHALISRHVISHILWHNMPSELILKVALRHDLRIIQGVIYYMQLIDLERAASKESDRVQIRLPLTMEFGKRLRFFSAHHSLLRLWEELRSSPPAIFSGGCLTHTECTGAWRKMWFEAGDADEATSHGSADVLGRLKSMMMALRKSLIISPSVTMQCKLSALEALSNTRDTIIHQLVDHFS